MVVLSSCAPSTPAALLSSPSPEPSPTWTRPPALECEPGARQQGGHGDYGVPSGGFPEAPERTPEEDRTLARKALEDWLDSRENPLYPSATAEHFVVTQQTRKAISFTYFEGEKPRMHIATILLGPDWHWYS